mgnify:CR=1 FL=1
MKLYNVTFTNPFFSDAIQMPVSEGKSLKLTRKQIAQMLNRYDLGYYANFLLSGKADEFIAERGGWMQQINGWFIIVK